MSHVLFVLCATGGRGTLAELLALAHARALHFAANCDTPLVSVASPSQVAAVWGFGVGIGIYCTADISGAHLNPAVTLALALFRSDAFPFRKIPFYWLAQIGGGVLGCVARCGGEACGAAVSCC